MDFEFSPEQQAFLDEVEAFLDENDDPDVFDVTRENMAQIVDTPEAPRVHGASSASRAGSASPGPKEYGGKEGDGVYEYLLNEALAGARRPADRQGRRHHRQDAHRARQRLAEGGVPAEDPAQRGRVRGRLQRAQRRLRRGVDEAQGRRATATAGGSTGRRRGPRRRTSPSGTGSAPAPIPNVEAPRHHAVPRAARPPRHHDQRDLDHGRRAHQRGVLRRRVRARRLRRRRGQPRLPVHLRRRSTSSASRCSRSRRSSSGSTCCATTSRTETRRRRAAARRPGGPPADRPARHRRRGGPACSGCGSWPSR